MNRQQAPQPVVRPVQVGDRIVSIDNIEDNTWILATDGVLDLTEPNAIAIRRVGKVMQIATKSTKVDFWYCIGEYNEGDFVVKSIHNGSNTVKINEEVFEDYMQVMGCESYDYVAEEPVNVAGFIE